MAEQEVVIALEDEENDLPVLYVKSLAGARTTVVPYFPEMQLWQYLGQVLAPRVPGARLSRSGHTVRHVFLSNTNSTGKQVMFDRENRLLRLGDLVQANAVLFHPGARGGEPLEGNAARGDVVEPCSICLEDGTDFELPSCHHRFHARCLGAYHARTAPERLCPMCRGSCD